MKNYYHILKINKNSSDLEIKKAYRKLAIKFHPDKNQNDSNFAEKFIEIKEAYDILIDPITRAEFDFTIRNSNIKFEEDYSNDWTEEGSYKSQRKASHDHYEETKFNYQKFDSFFSDQERKNYDTPHERPFYDFFGEKINDDFVFFGFPSQIGKIVAAYSNLTTNDNPPSTSSKILIYLIGFLFLIGINYLTIFIIETSIIWSIIWLLFSAAITFVMIYDGSTFLRINAYVGINGFSVFRVTKTRENVEKVSEIKYSDITDLFVYVVDRKSNFHYENTEFFYKFMSNSKIIYELKGTFDKNDNPIKQGFDIIFMRKVEQLWTIYRLDNMEKELEQNGFILFNIYPNKEDKTEAYIKLGIGFITFIKEKKEITYNFNDIQKVYSKGSTLFIRHNNFKKKLLFLKSGNEDEIPLLNLCNRNFFYKAMELLLGYRI